jgi:hypothetical protein
MKSFGYGLLVGPVVVACLSAYEVLRFNRLIETTRETRAVIRNAHIVSPKWTAPGQAAVGYRLDLDWRDDAGRARRAEQIAIDPALGRRLVEGNALVQDSVRIRYDLADPGRVLMIDPPQGATSQRNPFAQGLIAAGVSWPLSILGGLLFYFALRRERARGASDLSKGPAT